MLYYILPPFIIIISAGALIMFLFRKMDNAGEDEIEQPVSAQKTISKFDSLKAAFSQFGLKMLEKLMHRAKLLALKFHNSSNELFHSIKEKRESKMKVGQETKKQESEILQQIGEVLQASDDDRPRVKEMVLPSSHQELVSSTQKSRLKAKDKLEEVLIKRIAVNPRDIEAYERLGDYYLERENYDDSLECFKQVLKLSPAHHKARTRIRKLENLLK